MSPHSSLLTPHSGAKRRFGQNFLHDPGVIERIVRSIDPKPGEAMVEIGPGLGALTVPLLERAGELQVIEIDRDLIPPLQERARQFPGLRVLQADALEVDFGAFAADGRPLRIVGNLPYNISTPLLFHLLQFSSSIRDMHFMLQKEVVERMGAGAGDEAYGRLSVTLAARAEVHMLFKVGPGAFHPAPQVESAVVRLLPRPAPFPIDNLALFDRIVTAAFGQRRKRLSNALKGLMEAGQIEAAGVDPGLRAERLAPADFARLVNLLAHTRVKSQKELP
ncbi:MAG TPA: 16S rRNA (adenine(1518)-N(6)/adenine(1519)-N(6))-dimethyltransferase RsmA [Solimonas sp.]|nr:16S rRNA (adenine(1518)-N(6)/adenine(1519)-N(6))-dimethyltransferase RsmA [Solimonas sp.]